MSKTLHRSLEAKLAALDGPEWDSSDEDIPEPEATKKAVTKKNKGVENKNVKKAIKETLAKEDTSRVIYVGHLPSEFQELQILSFFSQFGKVTNVKLSRSERTGNPRGYAFVEFQDEEVTAIVADTMSGYILKGERRLVCHIVPKDKIHSELFHGAKENLAMSQKGYSASFHLKKLHDKIRKEVNTKKSESALTNITKRLLQREQKRRDQLKNLGIDYDFPGYAASIQAKSAAKTTEGKKRKVSTEIEDVKVSETHTSMTKKQKKVTETSGDTPIKPTSMKNKAQNSSKKTKN